MILKKTIRYFVTLRRASGYRPTTALLISNMWSFKEREASQLLDLFRTSSMTPDCSVVLTFTVVHLFTILYVFVTSSLQTRLLFIHLCVVPHSILQHKHVTGGSRSPQLYSNLYWDRVYRQRDKNSLLRRRLRRQPI